MQTKFPLTPKSSPEYWHAVPAASLELEELPPLLELSSPEGEDGDDSEQAKTIREIAAASVGIVSFMVSTPLVNLLRSGH
jgi:hypothetical protein